MKRQFCVALTATLCCGLMLQSRSHVSAAEEEANKTIKIFDSLTLSIPADWEKKEVRSRIIEHEFAVAEGEGEDAPAARITMMAAGGGVQPNIDRWEGQFSGDKTAEVEKMQVAGQTVHLVQLEGTFNERMGGGPFAGGRMVKREDYAMLGAIIQMQDGRLYFIKATGPAAVLKGQKDAFKKMLKELK